MPENNQSQAENHPTHDELITEYKEIGPDAYFRKYAAPLRPEGFEIARQKAEEEMKIRPLKKLGEVCRKLLKKQD